MRFTTFSYRATAFVARPRTRLHLAAACAVGGEMPSSAPKKAARAAVNRTQAILISAVLIAATLLMVLHSSVIDSRGSSRLPTRFFAATSPNGASGTKKSHSTSPVGSLESQTPPPGAAPLRGAVTQTPQRASNVGQRTDVSQAHVAHPNVSWQSHPDRSSGLERTPSALIPSPTWQEVLDARGRLAQQCAHGDAWTSQYWFTHRNESVAAQHTVRDALNLEGQYHVSRLAAASDAQLRPCRRTVVSIATIPSRIGRLHNLIRALREQDVPPDAILVALPPFAPRLRQVFTVPAFLAEDPLVTIVRLPVDFGPLSKVAAAIYAEQDPATCIITCVVRCPVMHRDVLAAASCGERSHACAHGMRNRLAASPSLPPPARPLLQRRRRQRARAPHHPHHPHLGVPVPHGRDL